MPLLDLLLQLDTAHRQADTEYMKEQSIPARAGQTAQTWNTSAYAANGRFVADLATGVVDLLAPKPGEHILDIGCGDGALTERLAATGATLTGIDASDSMIRAARERNLDVHQISATALTFEQIFDAAFSNAALHWIPEGDQPLALARIFASLKPGARFVAEMGGQGNIAAIRVALSSTLASFGIEAEHAAASFYPSPAQYTSFLQQAGFEVQVIDLIPRPTPLPGGPDGMKTWLNTFRNGVLDQLPATDRQLVVDSTVDLLRPVLSDRGQDWTADYVRLRFLARRPR